jgi:hypothetical protein
MTEPPTNPSSREDQVNALLAAYLDAAAAGRPPDRQELLARHPDLAAELTAFFAEDDQVRRLAEPLRPPPEDDTLAPAQTAADPSLGVVRYFGDYELLQEIARGGMGVVYRARQVSLDRIVALKMILAGHLAGEDDVQRFRQEARTAAGLQHPGIVALHEVGEHDGQHFFSMDFIEGKSLADMVREQPLPPAQAIRYVRQVAEALQFAHERGVLHRDLKPSNVLVDRFDTPRVTDFGLAKHLDKDAGLTASGAVVGTPSYIPPEQASGQRGVVGPHSDVYSLGALLYELVTGRPPFRAATPVDTILQVLQDEPAPPRLLNPAISRDLETVLLKCLAKDPARRYRAAKDLADDLQALLDGRPVRARRPGLVERAGRWISRNRSPAALAGLSGLAAVVLVTAFLFGVEQYGQWQRGWLYLENEGPVLTGEVLDPDGRRVLPRFTVPTDTPLALPAGAYQLRLRGRGFLDEVLRVDVERGREHGFQVSLAEQRLWEPIAVPRSYECVRMGDRHDVLALSRTGLARIHGGTGKTIWQTNLGEKDHPLLAGFRWDWDVHCQPSGRNDDDRLPRLLQPAVDLDRDGTPDLVWASRRQVAVLALSGKDGKVRWCFQAPRPTFAPNSRFNEEQASTGVVLGVAALPDLDGDGVPDLVATCASQQHADGRVPRWLQALSGRTGRPLWRFDLDPRWFAPPPGGAPFEALWNNTQGIASGLMQIFADGYDLVFGTDMSHGTGLPVPYPAAVVRLGGRPAVVLVAGDRLVGLEPRTGTPLWPAQPLGFWPVRPPQWTDLDADGQDDVLLLAPGERTPAPGDRGEEHLKLVALALTTRKPLWQTPFRGYWAWPWFQQPFTWPLVADLDGDGKPEVIVPTGDFEGDSKWSGVQVCDGATGEVRWLRKLSRSSRFGKVQQVNRILVGPPLDGSGCRGIFTAVLDGDFFPRDLPSGNFRPRNFDKDYNHPVILLDALSGQDGHSVWWARLRVPSAALTTRPKPSVGPLAWWHAGKDGWPQLVVPYVPGSPQDERLRYPVYIVSAGTGRVQHVGTDYRELRTLDLDGDGTLDLLAYRPDRLDAWDQGGKLEAIRGRSAEAWRRLGGLWQLAGDLDGDGVPDLVSAPPRRPGVPRKEVTRDRDEAATGALAAPTKKTLAAAISGRTGQVLWRREINDSQRHTPWQDTHYTWLHPSSVDLDGDGVPDLLATGPGHGFYSREPRYSPLLAVSGRAGRRIWEADIAIGTWSGPQVLACRDLDGDGQPEILFVSAMDWGRQPNPNQHSSPRTDWQYWLAVLSGRDGKVRWKQPLCSPGPHNLQAARSFAWALADLDGDGVQDVIVEGGSPGSDGEVHAFRGTDGKPLWKWSVPPSKAKQRWASMSRPTLTVGDLDGDGVPEVVVLSTAQEQDDQNRVWVHAEVHILDGATGRPRGSWREPVANGYNEKEGARVTPVIVHQGGKRRAVCVWTWHHSKGGQIVLLDATARELCRQSATFRLNGEWWRHSLEHPGGKMAPIYGTLFRVWAVDLDGDGSDELVYFTSDRLRISSGRLDRVLAEWPLPEEDCEMLEVRPGTDWHPPLLVVRTGNRVVFLDRSLGKPVWTCGGPGKPVAVAWGGRGSTPRVIYELDNEVTACRSVEGGTEELALPPASSRDDPRFVVSLPWYPLSELPHLWPLWPATLLATLLGVSLAVLVLPGAMLVWTVRRRAWPLLPLPLLWLLLACAAANLLFRARLEVEAGLQIYGLGEVGFAWRVARNLVLAALAGLPAVAFLAAALVWLRQGRWRSLALLLLGSMLLAALIAAVWLSAPVPPLGPEQRYSWRGWYAVWPVGVYAAGLLILGAFLLVRALRLGRRGWHRLMRLRGAVG